jgi:hypothetical protein
MTLQFSDNIVNAMQILISLKYGDLKATQLDFAFADVNSKINFEINSKARFKDIVRGICSYTSHLYFEQDNRIIDIIKLYDKPPNMFIDEFTLIKDTFNVQDKSIYKNIKAEWEIKEANSEDKLVSSEKKIIKETGYSAGEDLIITPYDYIESNIERELDKTLSLYKNFITINFETIEKIDVFDIVLLQLQNRIYKIAVTSVLCELSKKKYKVSGVYKCI